MILRIPAKLKRRRGRTSPCLSARGKPFPIILCLFPSRSRILFSAIVTSIPSLFVQNVIQVIEKWYVSRDWVSAKAELIPILSLLISLYVLSIIAILVYKQLMAYMTQGFLDKLRQEMFGGMQDLPIRYFDTHQHGDIMSFYTNDIDTLRQLVSEAIPAFIQSGAIVLAVFGIMLYFSIWLTLISVLGVILMIVVTKRVGGGSAKFFLRQQQAVAKTEGYIQETMTGQKVVKVFCHEQRSIEEFDKINDALFEDSYRAHAYASVLGPIIGNIGNFLYVALALVGGVLLLIGVPNLSLSGKALDISILVPFLNMTKQFTGNINQLSQQINSIVMAGAGAQRVFSLIDEKAETDDGFVTLVDADIAPDGTITESDHHTGHWAWKNPNDNGKASYRELRGDVRLIDVDFGYEPKWKRSCTTSLSTRSPVRRSPLSARPARARRPSRTSSTAFTTLPTARFSTTASTSARSKRPTCAARSASSCRTSTSSPAR